MRALRRTERGLRQLPRGFTLIELLVVVAIIALLISILLPSLGAARRSARAVKCAANMHSVGQAFSIYLAENRAVYPPSYIYPHSPDGGYDLNDQPADHPYGYLHWSWFLFNRGAVKDDAFQCPDIPNGGIPRTNPGLDPSNWEGNHDQLNGTRNAPSPLEDRQASRMAYTANAAVIPRNKFSPELVEQGAGLRLNKLVREQEIVVPRGVILAAEFNKNWLVETKQGSSGLLKSHRPVCAFYSRTVANLEYSAPPNSDPRFIYGNDSPDYGLRPLNDLESAQDGMFDTDYSEMNIVGRHHPGGDKLGGTSNFLFTDGHVTRETIMDTLKKREWGNKYFSLTGNKTDVDITYEPR